MLTGQHSDLDPADFKLAGFAAMHLGCAGQSEPNLHVRKVTARLLPSLLEKPDLLIVQGDTSSALGGALAAFAAGVAVAHVEAGLRTHDPSLPWPEEEYRTAIDARADLLFAPTQLAAANLCAERVPGEVHITGNTGIDALIAIEAELPARVQATDGTPRILVTCHRRESWGEGLTSIAAALVELAGCGGSRIEMLLHPNPHVAAKMRELLDGCPGIELTPPCSHGELVRRARDAVLILSDSGGIQEEAPALGTPLLVLRHKTERPEAVASGNARLVGTSRERIVTEARRLLENPEERAKMARCAYPFGDGRAAPRIAAIIEDWLERRTVSLTTTDLSREPHRTW